MSDIYFSTTPSPLRPLRELGLVPSLRVSGPRQAVSPSHDVHQALVGRPQVQLGLLRVGTLHSAVVRLCINMCVWSLAVGKESVKDLELEGSQCILPDRLYCQVRAARAASLYGCLGSVRHGDTSACKPRPRPYGRGKISSASASLLTTPM